MGHEDLGPAQAQQALEKALNDYTGALRELKRLHIQGRLCSHPIWTFSDAGEQWLRDTKATQKQVIFWIARLVTHRFLPGEIVNIITDMMWGNEGWHFWFVTMHSVG
ncbi:MAG: hypothetical protein Q9207_001686 [Kuettlingeria erythrocarpa]